ncbi:MAG TPA: hypothetical protein VKC57_11690, partial [Ktedonobacterales bacterium]|nr:hypothetical protein [Ktedonobacterales bacterium]
MTEGVYLPHMARALSTAREDEILKLRRQGKTHFQIASAVGLTRQRVTQILQARGDTFQPPVKGTSAETLPNYCPHCGG